MLIIADADKAVNFKIALRVWARPLARERAHLGGKNISILHFGSIVTIDQAHKEWQINDDSR